MLVDTFFVEKIRSRRRLGILSSARGCKHCSSPEPKSLGGNVAAERRDQQTKEHHREEKRKPAIGSPQQSQQSLKDRAQESQKGDQPHKSLFKRGLQKNIMRIGTLVLAPVIDGPCAGTPTENRFLDKAGQCGLVVSQSHPCCSA